MNRLPKKSFLAITLDCDQKSSQTARKLASCIIGPTFYNQSLLLTYKYKSCAFTYPLDILESRLKRNQNSFRGCDPSIWVVFLSQRRRRVERGNGEKNNTKNKESSESQIERSVGRVPTEGSNDPQSLFDNVINKSKALGKKQMRT